MSASEEVERLRVQARALAHFGSHALRTHDLDALLQEAVALVSDCIGVDLVKVLELLPDQDTLLVRAGVNWKPGVVGNATFGAHEKSPGGYALREDAPTISNDVETEGRFEIPELLVEHHVKSMINVVIRGEGAAWGVLEVDSRQHRAFNEDDASFLQNYANMIAAAIDRLRTEAELKEAADRSSFLLGELQHRVQNMLVNVRAMARRTARASASVAAFSEAFDARLMALARTQDLLTAGSAAIVGLENALRQELKAHGAEPEVRVSLSGPDVRLSPKTVRALSMVFHELATNASKYGALHHDGGRLAVSWQIAAGDETDEVRVTWRETGVPIDGSPTRRGFGTEAIERTLPHMLGGETRVEFHSDGVECTVRFPLVRSRKPDGPETKKEGQDA
jgi:two-component sensor histidine kinase